MRKVQLAVFLLVPIVNFLPMFLFESPFDQNPEVLIQPAGYAFSIWGLIFIAMIIYSVFQLKMERIESPHLRTATYAAISAGLASIVFVPLSYTNVQFLVFPNILWHLISLIILYRALHQQIGFEPDPRTRWYYLGTQLYLGWISAATAVSMALFLRDFGVAYDTMTEVYITVGVLIALIGIALWITTKGGQAIALTIVWALGGIIVENGVHPPIYFTAVTGIILLTGMVLYTVVQGKKLYEQDELMARMMMT